MFTCALFCEIAHKAGFRCSTAGGGRSGRSPLRGPAVTGVCAVMRRMHRRCGFPHGFPQPCGAHVGSWFEDHEDVELIRVPQPVDESMWGQGITTPTSWGCPAGGALDIVPKPSAKGTPMVPHAASRRAPFPPCAGPHLHTPRHLPTAQLPQTIPFRGHCPFEVLPCV